MIRLATVETLAQNAVAFWISRAGLAWSEVHYIRSMMTFNVALGRIATAHFASSGR